VIIVPSERLVMSPRPFAELAAEADGVFISCAAVVPATGSKASWQE